MTMLSRDEWHQLQVGETLLEDDWPGIPFKLEEYLVYQFDLGHTYDCPFEAYAEEFPDGTTVTHVNFHCNLAIDVEMWGSDWISPDAMNLGHGLYRVRATCHKDYWGEYDTEVEVEQLQGPVDERQFEGELISE